MHARSVAGFMQLAIHQYRAQEGILRVERSANEKPSLIPEGAASLSRRAVSLTVADF